MNKYSEWGEKMDKKNKRAETAPEREVKTEAESKSEKEEQPVRDPWSAIMFGGNPASSAPSEDEQDTQEAQGNQKKDGEEESEPEPPTFSWV